MYIQAIPMYILDSREQLKSLSELNYRHLSINLIVLSIYMVRGVYT